MTRVALEEEAYQAIRNSMNQPELGLTSKQAILTLLIKGMQSRGEISTEQNERLQELIKEIFHLSYL